MSFPHSCRHCCVAAAERSCFLRFFLRKPSRPPAKGDKRQTIAGRCSIEEWKYELRTSQKRPRIGRQPLHDGLNDYSAEAAQADIAEKAKVSASFRGH